MRTGRSFPARAMIIRGRPGVQPVVPASIAATSTVGGAISKAPKAVTPATINATSTASGAVTKRPKAITPGQINAYSVVYAGLPRPKTSVTLTRHLSDGAVIYKGSLYSLTINSNYVYYWPDPGDLSTFTASLVDASRLSPSSLVVDYVNDCMWGGVSVANGTDITLFRIDRNGTGLASVLIDTTIGTSGTDLYSINSAIEVDTNGVYLYVALQNVLANSYILKVRLSDGAIVAQVQLPNPSDGGDSKNATNLKLTAEGKLIVTGQTGNGFIARLDKSLNVEEIRHFSTNMSAVDDDCLEIGNYMWFGYEGASGNGRLCKIAKADFTDQTYYTTGQGQGIDGMWLEGNYIWVGHLGTPSRIAKFNWTTGTTEAAYALTTGEGPVNEVFRWANGLILLTYENASRAIFLPLAATRSLTAGTISATSTVGGDISGIGGTVKSITPASISATSTVSGQVTRRVAISHGIVATSTVSGSIVVRRAVIPATVSATSTTSGTVTRRIAVSGTVNATSTVSASVTRKVAVKPTTINATSVVSGQATKLAAISGAISATSTASGAVTRRVAISHGIVATSTVSGNLVHGIQPATINATSTTSGTVTRRVAIAGAVSATSTVSGAVRRIRAVPGGTVNATSTVAGAVTRRIAITKGIVATSTVSGTVTKGRQITPTSISATSTVAATPGYAHRLLPATILATSTASATVTARRGVSSALINATSTVTVLRLRSPVFTPVYVVDANDVLPSTVDSSTFTSSTIDVKTMTSSGRDPVGPFTPDPPPFDPTALTAATPDIL